MALADDCMPSARQPVTRSSIDILLMPPIGKQKPRYTLSRQLPPSAYIRRGSYARQFRGIHALSAYMPPSLTLRDYFEAIHTRRDFAILRGADRAFASSASAPCRRVKFSRQRCQEKSQKRVVSRLCYIGRSPMPFARLWLLLL